MKLLNKFIILVLPIIFFVLLAQSDYISGYTKINEKAYTIIGLKKVKHMPDKNRKIIIGLIDTGINSDFEYIKSIYY